MKFKEIYRQILKQSKNRAVDGVWPSVRYSYPAFDDTWRIIDQYVSDPDLTPVPKGFLDEMQDQIDWSRNGAYEFPFKDLVKLLKMYNYPYYEALKANLEQWSTGQSLYIICMFGNDAQRDLKTLSPWRGTQAFQLISGFNIEDRIKKAINDNLVVSAAHVDDACSNALGNPEFSDGAMIYVDLQGEYPKDSLEHELTHFVQRIVGRDKSLENIRKDRRFEINVPDQLFFRISEGFPNIQSFLYDFAGIKLAETELHQTIKAIISGIQRIYERNSFSKAFPELQADPAKDSPEYRAAWLEKALPALESDECIDRIIKPAMGRAFAEQGADRQRWLMAVKPAVVAFLRILVKTAMPDLDLDGKLKTHFAEFVYGD